MVRSSRSVRTCVGRRTALSSPAVTARAFASPSPSIPAILGGNVVDRDDRRHLRRDYPRSDARECREALWQTTRPASRRMAVGQQQLLSRSRDDLVRPYRSALYRASRPYARRSRTGWPSRSSKRSGEITLTFTIARMHNRS
jgi:hypothetical protein